MPFQAGRSWRIRPAPSTFSRSGTTSCPRAPGKIFRSLQTISRGIPCGDWSAQTARRGLSAFLVASAQGHLAIAHRCKGVQWQCDPFSLDLRLLNMVALNFYDDTYGLKTHRTAPSANIAAEAIHFWLGGLFGEKKRFWTTSTMTCSSCEGCGSYWVARSDLLAVRLSLLSCDGFSMVRSWLLSRFMLLHFALHLA